MGGYVLVKHTCPLRTRMRRGTRVSIMWYNTIDKRVEWKIGAFGGSGHLAPGQRGKTKESRNSQHDSLDNIIC